MSNIATLNISSPQGSHKVVLQKGKTPGTINSSLDDKAHALYDCSASSDGTSFSGTTLVVIFHDKVTVQLDPTTDSVAMNISGVGSYSGVLGPGEAVAAIAFVKACNLPSLDS